MTAGTKADCESRVAAERKRAEKRAADCEGHRFLHRPASRWPALMLEAGYSQCCLCGAVKDPIGTMFVAVNAPAKRL